MKSTNISFCHSCNDTGTKNKAINTAIVIGFYDAITETERPTTVYIHDFTNGTVRAFDVWNKYDLFTRQPFIVNEVPEMVSYSYASDWHEFTNDFYDLLNEPFNSTHSGYDFIQDSNIRNQVFTDVKSTWYSFFIGMASMFQAIDSFTSVLPDDIFLERMSITFSDNVTVNIRLVDGARLSLKQMLQDIPMEYIPDSAYLVSNNGQTTKLPDDYREFQENFTIEVNYEDIQHFENFMGNNGISWSAGGVATTALSPT